MKHKWDKKYLYSGITAFAVIACCVLFYWILTRWSSFASIANTVISAIEPFVYGLLIAYLVGKIVNMLENNIFSKLSKKMCKNAVRTKKLSRILSITTAMLLVLGLLSGMLYLILPEIYKSVENLIVMIPTYAKSVISWLESALTNQPELEELVVNMVGSVTEGLTSWAQNSLLPRADEIISGVTTGVFSIVKGLLNVLIGFVISVYVMYNKEVFSAQLKKMLYALFSLKTANSIMREYTYIKKAFGDFVAGKIIDSAIIGGIAYICLSILQMPYAALVSFIVGVTNVIPVFGPFIGAVPSALLILLESPLQCLIFVIFIIILQQIDGNIIGPKILGSSTGLSGFWVMFAILFFGGLFGIFGMIIGVPVTSVVYNAVKRNNEKKLNEKKLPTDTAIFRKIRYIDHDSGVPVYYKEFAAEAAAKSEDKSETEEIENKNGETAESHKNETEENI